MASCSRWLSLMSGFWFWFWFLYVAADDGIQKCDELRLGQYVCMDPEINPATQEPVGCANYSANAGIDCSLYRALCGDIVIKLSNVAYAGAVHAGKWNPSRIILHAPCYPAPNISCKDYKGNVTTFYGKEVGFYRPFPCRNVNGYSYKVAVALSLFLGWLGADRFYLGYPALGLLKFCTVGFCGIGSLIDFILISMQIVGPSDGSSYIIDYYGARLLHLTINNETFRESQLYP